LIKLFASTPDQNYQNENQIKSNDITYIYEDLTKKSIINDSENKSNLISILNNENQNDCNIENNIQ
jgi:hypothetical protein